MGGANGSRECAPDDKLRDTHHAHLSYPRKAGIQYAAASRFYHWRALEYWVARSSRAMSASARTFCLNGASPFWGWSQLHNRR